MGRYSREAEEWELEKAGPDNLGFIGPGYCLA